MHLDRAVGNAIGRFAGVELRTRGVRTETARTRFTRFLVPHKCGVVREGASGFDFGLHLREHPLDGLILGNRLSERAALLGVTRGSFHGTLSEPDGLCRDADAAAVE